MTAGVWLRSALTAAILLAPAGCKEPKTEGNAKQRAAAADGPTKEDIRKGIEKRAPLVQRHDAGMDLRNISQLYIADALGGVAPKKLEDLRGLDARTIQAVKDGVYVVLWGANPNAPGTAIVAYEKDVPTKGGMTANMTGSVVRMTPDEFKAAPKASGN
jgi:hypothetical protein